jgi:dTDP-4-amino-4,6-dideoxygalactose transaminase
MDRLLELCRKHGLYLIEDAAHAHGSRWDGRGAGTMGIGGTFSFQNSKNMTAGEGGIVLTDEEKLALRIESLASLGRRHGRPWYEFHEVGWNYRMTEFQAAILRCQLGRLELQNASRRENAAILAEGFEAIGGLDPVEVDPRAEMRSVHIYMLRYSPEDFKGLSRARLIEAVNAEGIPASAGYAHPLYRNPVFSGEVFNVHGRPVSFSPYRKNIDYASFAEQCPVAEIACAYEAVWLEHRLLLGDRRDMDDIVNAFAKVRKHCGELV